MKQEISEDQEILSPKEKKEKKDKKKKKKKEKQEKEGEDSMVAEEGVSGVTKSIITDM